MLPSAIGCTSANRGTMESQPHRPRAAQALRLHAGGAWLRLAAGLEAGPRFEFQALAAELDGGHGPPRAPCRTPVDRPAVRPVQRQVVRAWFPVRVDDESVGVFRQPAKVAVIVVLESPHATIMALQPGTSLPRIVTPTWALTTSSRRWNSRPSPRENGSSIRPQQHQNPGRASVHPTPNGHGRPRVASVSAG